MLDYLGRLAIVFDVQPPLLVLEYLADSASLDAKDGSQVVLLHLGMSSGVLADALAVDVEELRLALWSRDTATTKASL